MSSVCMAKTTFGREERKEAETVGGAVSIFAQFSPHLGGIRIGMAGKLTPLDLCYLLHLQKSRYSATVSRNRPIFCATVLNFYVFSDF